MSKTLELAQQREQLPFAEAHGAERKRIVIIRVLLLLCCS